MKPPRFDYHAPTSLREAVALLGELGPEAKLLAGGQSLIPLLNMRLARPDHLVDLNRVAELSYLSERDGTLAVGAMTRQRAVERSPLARDRAPLLVEAIGQIGHLAIRTRGTIGGSLAHADPAAELPGVLVALDGEVTLVGPAGTRVVGADNLFVTYLTTAARPEELVSEVRLPLPPPGTGHAWLEVARRHGDFALAGVGASVRLDPDGTIGHAGLALIGVGPTPVRPRTAEALLYGQRPTAALVREAGRRAAAEVEPDSDIHATADYRRHVAGVLVSRALKRALARAQREEDR